MRRLVVPSFAKINLTLQVLNQRSDGFHNLRTIFHTISLSDTITIDYEPSSSIDIALEGTVDIPENLVVRAARAVLEAAGKGARLRFHLEKRIPLGAGLGGGSSNAAVALMIVARLVGAHVDHHAIASAIGSDVPFFLTGGCALGQGRGTELSPLPDASPMPMLLVTPGIHVSTPPAFAALRRTAGYVAGVDTASRIAAVMGTGEEWDAGVNDFEEPVFAAHPELAGIKHHLLESRARKALMSGSGSSLFAIFRNEADCLHASRTLTHPNQVVRLAGREEYRGSLLAAL